MSSATQKVLITSIPKSGTNLVASIVALLPGLQFQKITLNRNLGRHPFLFIRGGRDELVPVGMQQPQLVPGWLMRRQLLQLNRGQFTTAHLPYSDVTLALLNRFDIRTIFVVRDPRDVLVSNFHHVQSRTNHFLHAEFNRLDSERSRYEMLLRGVHLKKMGRVCGLREQYDQARHWLASPGVQVTRFEDLVGLRGGGEKKLQIEQIGRLGELCGVKLDHAGAERIGDEMFGTGSTFRKGVVGGWRETLPECIRTELETSMKDVIALYGYE